MPRRSTIALATAGALASTGTAYLGARNLLVGQATHARTVIPKSFAPPPQADGVYGRGGGPVQRWRRGTPFDLHLMMFGDSTACGYGCTAAEEVPGVVIARNLAEQTGKRVRLSTKAIVGATSKGVCGQVDAMFVAGPPPDAAVIIIGANDITSLNGIGPSAERLASVVRKLRARGAVVVVGTCPDFGVITAIPQPLRSLAHTRGAQLARAQSIAVKAAGGTPVPLANLLASRLRSEPERMLSDDRYHPSAAAYALAADHLLLALRDALRAKAHQNGCRQEGSPTAPLPAPPEAPSPGAGQARGNIVSRLWRRPASGLPAAVPMPAVG
ncbi:SGNH/GDSL hydrolase family protein [Mycobacterium basiliense]|uniref:SGNH/GDSL hydrolase family protein n=1 Tax=Mycobacterium basiliense TaxID=2094119 RepID=UPI001300E7BA|nr:SGNH/GDSL hydrolase family protein [Mycobacterium basiliense]